MAAYLERMGSRNAAPRSLNEDVYDLDDAINELFSTILDTLAYTDMFGRETSSSIFIVYAHDNGDKGVSNASCVQRIIEWLRAIRSRTLSDKSLLPPWSKRDGGSDVVRNILSNQFCLLPACNSLDDMENFSSVDNVVVFGSEVLRQYYENDFTQEYRKDIKRVYMKQTEPIVASVLQKEIREIVESQCGLPDFHHVLTELAFLEIRRFRSENHGIIPFALDGNSMQYLPFLENCDLRLKYPTQGSAFDLQRLFFKLLEQIYTEEYTLISRYKECYRKASEQLQKQAKITRTEFQNIVHNEISKTQQAWLDLQTATIRGERWRNALDYRIDRAISRLHDGAVNPRKLMFLNGLSTLPYQDRKDRNPERVEGTCEWVTTHRLFKHWRNAETSSLLWISADPGCGKSVLAKHLVDNVLPTTVVRTTCYFFFKDDFEDQKNIESALRCLLHQMFSHRRNLLSDNVLEMFEKDNQLLNSFTGLWDILTGVASHQSAGEIVCILDALDECEEGGRSQIRRALNKFYTQEQSTSKLKFLLTSRPYATIQRGFQELENWRPTIHLKGEGLEAENIAEEIDVVIKAKVDELGTVLVLEDNEKQILRNGLTHFPNRTYLWVHLVIDAIYNSNGITERLLRDKIRELPPTVEAAYEKILSRSLDVRKTRRLLHIIVAAERPLSLQEMATALAIDKSHTHSHQLDLEPETRFRGTVRELCGLFVTITDSKIYLIHQTAREFLVRSLSSESLDPLSSNTLSQGWRSSFDPMDSNRILAEICLWYLVLEERDGSFLLYAATNWTDHLRKANGTNTHELMPWIERACDIKSPAWLQWFKLYRNKRGGDSLPLPTPLIIASYFGLEEYCRLLLNREGVKLDARDKECGRDAPSWARAKRYKTVVSMSLHRLSRVKNISKRNHGTAINARDEYGRAPIWYATCNGHTCVVEALIEKGANIETEDQDGKTPLFWAAEMGHEEMVRLLLNKGASVNARDNTGRTPLFWAAQRGHEEVVRLLLAEGANIETKDERGRTPLLRAVYIGHKEIVRLLLEKGANIETKDEEGWTPLLQAVSMEQEKMVRLLLEKGANIDAKDNDGQTSLEIALLHVGERKKVEQLLQEHIGSSYST